MQPEKKMQKVQNINESILQSVQNPNMVISHNLMETRQALRGRGSKKSCIGNR